MKLEVHQDPVLIPTTIKTRKGFPNYVKLKSNKGWPLHNSGKQTRGSPPNERYAVALNESVLVENMLVQGMVTMPMLINCK